MSLLLQCSSLALPWILNWFCDIIIASYNIATVFCVYDSANYCMYPNVVYRHLGDTGHSAHASQSIGMG